MESNSEVAWLVKQVRLMKVALVGVATLVALLVATVIMDRIGVPDEMRARGFALVDEAGAPLAHLSRTPEGAVLALQSRTGSTKIFLGMGEDVVGLALAVNDGVRASLTVGEEGVPTFTLRDGRGRARIVSAIDTNDQPALSVWNPAGGLDFIVRPGHSPVLQVFDADGHPFGLGEVKNGPRVIPEPR
jgi:hypothetical protein